MTTTLDPGPVAERVRAVFPDAVRGVDRQALLLQAGRVRDVARWLAQDDALDLVFLSNLTAIDRESHFEMVYFLQSLDRNHLLEVKAVLADREAPVVPSLAPVFRGALLQEREVYDLFGIRFDGHPDLRRLLLWEGFPGWPLRKDFLQMPGNLRAGLPGFPHEPGENVWPVPGSPAWKAQRAHPSVTPVAPGADLAAGEASHGA